MREWTPRTHPTSVVATLRELFRPRAGNCDPAFVIATPPGAEERLQEEKERLWELGGVYHGYSDFQWALECAPRPRNPPERAGPAPAPRRAHPPPLVLIGHAASTRRAHSPSRPLRALRPPPRAPGS